ncbi:MAG: Cof-type HAD-IIB family hydrolase [Acidobacteriia bacterium]|nr:Cof-type HAD-IIB family hydrolase [Terriglobia bacterium]
MNDGVHLIAIDIDGTLLDSKGRLSEENKHAVDAAVDAGIEVSLVTGRRFSMAERIATLFEHDLTVIANNGAVIKTSRSHHLSYKDPLPLPAARQALYATRAFRSSCVAHAEESEYGQLVCEGIDPNNLPLRWYLDKSKEDVRYVDSLEEFLTVDPIQLMFGGALEVMNGVIQAVTPLVEAGVVKMARTEYLRNDVSIIDILSPTCSKAAALQFLLARHGWIPENLMAIGDNHNDHDMLELSKIAVVMGQSVEELKTTSRYVTATNDENGVAQAIERFVLK